MPPKPPKQVESLATIDPTALEHVSGGASRGTATQDNSGTSQTDIYNALSGILDSINDLAGQRSSGFSTTEMLMLMYVLNSRNHAPTVVTAPPWGLGNGGYYIVRR